MKIVVAPGPFKGSLTSTQAAQAMAIGVKRVFPAAEVVQIPMSDGGGGTTELLVRATDGEMLTAEVTGPLGDKVNASYGILGDGVTAVVEVAAASGFSLVPADQRNPFLTTTYGTGELIRQALDQEPKRLIIGLGDSATCDGGAGCMQALGAKLLDASGQEVPVGGGHLQDIKKIDLTDFDPRLKNTEIIVACDSFSPLIGPKGSARMYGPQKGATPEMVEVLESGLQHWANLLWILFKKETQDMEGAGAAGGLGASLTTFCGAKLTPGAGVVLEYVGFEKKVEGATLCITGEGKMDEQTLYGKGASAVAGLAKKNKVPVVAVAGALDAQSGLLYEKGIDAMVSIVPGPMELKEAMANAANLIEDSTERLLNWLLLGNKISFK